MNNMEKRNYIFCVFSGEFCCPAKKLKSRDKLDWVWFYDYSKLIWTIISEMSYWQIQELRLKIYQHYKHYICFTSFSRIENATDWTFIRDWIKVSSWIFKIPVSVFASMLPSKTRKKYFNYDNFYEKYMLKTDFIYYLD